MAELEKFKAQAAVEEQNEVLVRSAFDRLSKGDEAVYQDMYAPEYSRYFPTLNPKALTREEEAGIVKMLRAGFPDIRWDIIEMVVSADMAVARFVEVREETDLLGFMQQLGMALKPAEKK